MFNSQVALYVASNFAKAAMSTKFCAVLLTCIMPTAAHACERMGKDEYAHN